MTPLDEELSNLAAPDVSLDDVAHAIGRRRFLFGAGAAAAGAALGTSLAPATAGAVEAGAGFFTPMEPTRFVDTRRGFGYQRLDGKTIRVQIAGRSGIPTNASAVVMTLTQVNSVFNGRNNAAAYPSGIAKPNTSSVNSQYLGDVVANLVTVQLGSSPKGYLDVACHNPGHVVVDVAGYYTPTAVNVAGGRFIALANAMRVLDTRRAGFRKVGAKGTVQVNLNGVVATGAVAVVANLTIAESNGKGFCTAYPIGGTLAETSNINLGPGQTRAVGIMTKLGTKGGVTGFNVYSMRGGHVIVDVVGYITGPNAAKSGDGLFVPVTPYRAIDTRQSTGVKKRLWPGWTRAFTLPAPMNSKAQAVVGNLTVTKTMGKGFFYCYPAQTPRYEGSNLNVVGPDQTVANHVTVTPSTKGVAIYSHKGGHVIFDVMGWFTGKVKTSSTFAPVDPPPPPGPLPWGLQVPRMGLSHGVYEGDPNYITNLGQSWHWTGTGLVGQKANVVTFGHRRTHGRPYWYQHELRNGDLMYVRTADNRLYTYKMAAEYITSNVNSDILAHTRPWPGVETFALVACTGDGTTSTKSRLPGNTSTSIKWRIVSVFTLVQWADLG